MHGDEGDVGGLGAEPFHEVGADVDRDHLVAEPFQRVLDPGAGAQRDAALERAAALEHGDLHPDPSPARRNGTTFSPLPAASSDRGTGSRRSPVSAP